MKPARTPHGPDFAARIAGRIAQETLRERIVTKPAPKGAYALWLLALMLGTACAGPLSPTETEHRAATRPDAFVAHAYGVASFATLEGQRCRWWDAPRPNGRNGLDLNVYGFTCEGVKGAPLAVSGASPITVRIVDRDTLSVQGRGFGIVTLTREGLWRSAPLGASETLFQRWNVVLGASGTLDVSILDPEAR